MFCTQKNRQQKLEVFFRNTNLAHILIDAKFIIPSWKYNSKNTKSTNKKTNPTTNKPQGIADAVASTETT